MKLIADELITTLAQPMTPTEHMDLYAIVIRLYLHNAPSGTVRLKIKKASDLTLIATSETLNLATIRTDVHASQGYVHADVRFLVSARLSEDVQYLIVFEPVTYTFSNSSFVGWCRAFDLGDGKETYSNPSGTNAEFCYRPYGYVWKVKGA